MELNFKSREEIFALRKGFVQEHPDLVRSVYEPSEPFAAIESSRPWWGTVGLDHYWVGPRSIEGPSDQSRFLANPFLLVALREHYALANVLPPDVDAPRLLPDKIEWNAAAATATARYAVRPYFDFLSRYGGYEWILELIAYNARDFGYDYIAVDREGSRGVDWQSPTGKPLKIVQMIHCGGSCGYPGGCNNMSPTPSANMLVKIKDLPATLRVKLWREKADFADEKADMTFVIEMR